jgi:chromosomal replication initiation ATPase DnaA
VAFDRLRRDATAARVVGLVATSSGVPPVLLLHKSRCTADVARARQLAMYLMHIVLQRTYEDVGRVFGRERTTIAHACAIIEDLRDEPAFDKMVSRLEASIGEVPEAEVARAAG